MKIKRRIPDAHDSVYEIGADNAQQADPNISEGKTLTFEEEDEDPEDKQTSTYVKEVSNSEDINLEIKDVMGLPEAQKKLTFKKEDPGDPEADMDDSFTDSAADSEDPDEFTKLGNGGKSEIEHFNVTIETNFKLPQGDPGEAKFQSTSADCLTNISADPSPTRLRAKESNQNPLPRLLVTPIIKNEIAKHTNIWVKLHGRLFIKTVIDDTKEDKMENNTGIPNIKQ